MKRFLLSITMMAALLAPPDLAQSEPLTLAAKLHPVTPATAPRYSITDLGTLGGPMSQGMGNNENNQVVGASQSGTYAYAFLWDDGTMTTGPTGRLEIPLIGNSAGLYGSLSITGTANLDGVLALKFSQGFAPQQGDMFTFLTATEGTSGTFDSVEISGLMPGFEYDLTIVDGQVTLEALNDGLPVGRVVFLPLVVR